MQVNVSFRGLIPLCVEKEIACIAKLLDTLRVEMLSVGNGKGMVVADVLLREPISNLIFMVVLDISVESIVISEYSRSATFLSPLVKIRFSSRCGGKSLEDEEASQTKGPLKAPLENGGVNARAIQIGPIDLKVPVRILGKTILVGRTAPSEIDVVYLGNEAAQCSGSDIDLLAVIGSASSINIETCEDLADRLVNAQDDLRLSASACGVAGDGSFLPVHV